MTECLLEDGPFLGRKVYRYVWPAPQRFYVPHEGTIFDDDSEEFNARGLRGHREYVTYRRHHVRADGVVIYRAEEVV